jgi:hypothetical protein
VPVRRLLDAHMCKLESFPVLSESIVRVKGTGYSYGEGSTVEGTEKLDLPKGIPMLKTEFLFIKLLVPSGKYFLRKMCNFRL